uniref:Uncharacterized protein n=1 Tax=Latimeria chalumnae TaxID=7897 RepID=H3ADT3_LATCH
MAAVIGHLEQFDKSVEQWISYIEWFEHFTIANGISEGRKVAALLSVIGGKTYGLLRSLIAVPKPGDKTYKDIVEVFQEHFCPKPLVIADRFRFHKCNQEEGESITQDVAVLKKLAQHCEFDTALNATLRDRLVCSLRSEAIQKRLLSESTLTY